MKAKRIAGFSASAEDSNRGSELKEVAAVEGNFGEPMIRTQIYLSRREHDFVLADAKRRNQPMAAVIRGFIDQEMELPADVWTNNPMLRPPPVDAEWNAPADAAINHDHYLYGSAKKWVKTDGNWVMNPLSAEEAESPPTTEHSSPGESASKSGGGK